MAWCLHVPFKFRYVEVAMERQLVEFRNVITSPGLKRNTTFVSSQWMEVPEVLSAYG